MAQVSLGRESRTLGSPTSRRTSGTTWNRWNIRRSPRIGSVELTDQSRLGIATLGALKQHPRIAAFRRFIEGWHLSYFSPDEARGLPLAGPQKHLNGRGDNLGNVVQYMERDHRDRFRKVLDRITSKIPGVDKIDTERTSDGRLLLRFNDRVSTIHSMPSRCPTGRSRYFPACCCSKIGAAAVPVHRGARERPVPQTVGDPGDRVPRARRASARLAGVHHHPSAILRQFIGSRGSLDPGEGHRWNFDGTPSQRGSDRNQHGCGRLAVRQPLVQRLSRRQVAGCTPHIDVDRNASPSFQYFREHVRALTR